jgi:serine/threonine-protein kinase
MILAGAHAGAQELVRFRAEAEAIARLQHPHIVQVYEIREHDGLPCFSLEYVEGGSLAAKLTGAAWPARQAAQLVAAVAEAIHAAHQRGIIHRDLKPGNILLTRDGTPKLTDFGLAKQLGGTGQTVSGAILGTPSYMAPEQAQGDNQAIGPAVDVYSLGAILYELTTGRPPFRAATVLETLHQVHNDDPVPPSRLSPNLPRDVETICLKCLQKEPRRRYESAAALARDLHAFLAGEPIQARPSTRWERAQHWLRRRPVLALLLGVAGVAVLGLVVGLFFYNAIAVSASAVLVLLGAGWRYTIQQRAALRAAAAQRAWSERQVERVNLLLEMTRNLMAAPSLDELLLRLSETTTRLVNAERATIFLIDWERRQVWSRVALGTGVGEIRVALGQGIAGTVALTGETINLPDAYADPRFNPEVDKRTGYQTRNLLALPMTAQNGRIMGVFQVLNKRDGPFQAEDVAALNALAASAMVAVERAKFTQT